MRDEQRGKRKPDFANRSQKEETHPVVEGGFVHDLLSRESRPPQGGDTERRTTLTVKLISRAEGGRPVRPVNLGVV